MKFVVELEQMARMGRFRASPCLKLGQKSLDFLVRAPSRKNPTSSGSGSGGTFRARVGIFFCVFFSFQILKNLFYYHYLYYRAGLILTKNPVARKTRITFLLFRLCSSRRCGSFARVNTRNGANARALERIY